jgi:branched-subunit amino acid ABC-type transport system permease component
MVLASFGISAALGAIGGIIVSPITTMEYGRGPLFLIKGFAAVIWGGMGNFYGAEVAGFLIGIFEAFAAGLISSGYKDAVALVALILNLVLRPTGLFGRHKEEEGDGVQFVAEKKHLRPRNKGELCYFKTKYILYVLPYYPPMYQQF